MEFKTWNEIQEAVADCEKCDLCKTRHNTVFGEGPVPAKIMFIGEGPGQVEDETGRPFVGPAGRMLDNLLQDIGLRREEVYIANVLKCRPPGNRNPRPEEISACMPYIRAQTAFVKPKIIVGLGKFGAGLVLKRDVPIMREHGKVFRVKSFVIIPTFHPAALLHRPENEQFAREDFRIIREQLDALQQPG